MPSNPPTIFNQVTEAAWEDSVQALRQAAESPFDPALFVLTDLYHARSVLGSVFVRLKEQKYCMAAMSVSEAQVAINAILDRVEAKEGDNRAMKSTQNERNDDEKE